MTRLLPFSLGSALTLLLAVAPASWAQSPSVKFVLDATVVEVGEVVEAKLVCTNTGVPDPPIFVPTAGVALILVNSVPARFSQQSWINGRRTSQETYTYQMRLTAKKVGRFKIGPISVTAGARSYRAKPVTITVRPSQTISAARGDRMIFTEIEVKRDSLYVTESVVATLTIGIRQVVLQGRTQRVKLLGIIDTARSELSVFGGSRASASQVRLADSNGVRHTYEIFKVQKELRAEEVGDMTIGPVFLRANYPTKLRRNIWGDLSSTRSRKETARAEAVRVEVRSPPIQGRPGSFHGAIGRYAMAVIAEPTQVEQGQPITVTLTIRGRPLEGIAPPDLSKSPELVSRFEFSTEEMIGTLEQRDRVFRRAVFPKQAGEQTLPAIEWSYFDLRKEQYVTLASDPIALIVDPSSSPEGSFNLADAANDMARATSLTLLHGGISPNYVDPSVVLANQTFSLTKTALGLALTMPPVGWLLITLGVWHRRRLTNDVALARRRRAAGAAYARVRAVQASGGAVAIRSLATALTGYVADRYDLPPGELTPDEVRQRLSREGVSEPLVEEMAAFLELADAVEYAPGSAQEPAVAEAAGKVRLWIKELDRTS